MLIIFLFLSLFIIGKGVEQYPVLEIEDGKIRGFLQRTDGGKIFYAFKEIPYAKPPIGELRFTEPAPPEKWKGILEVTNNTKICMQKNPLFPDREPDLKENEDCLYLNVFTPNTENKNYELLPVYVYIYGGFFIAGDPTDYNFQHFLEEDIVIVTMNFRSGPLGFLSTGDGVIPGNLWMKDQLLALKWVNKNIKIFGGDPEKVTLGGHSSGAVNVGYHILNENAKGLFRAAIVQSSSFLSEYELNPKQAAYKFVETLDRSLRFKDSYELLRWLRTLPADVITRSNYTQNVMHLQWKPAIIENFKLENVAINRSLYYKAENGIFNHVPLFIGTTDQESLHLNLTLCQIKIDENLSNIFLPKVNIKQENRLKAAMEVQNIYTQANTFKENISALIRATSDSFFTNNLIIQANLHSEFADVYFYQFSYKGPLNGLEQFKKSHLYHIKGIGKAAHCDELPFLYDFGLYQLSGTPSEEDLLMRKKLIKLWTNFIKYLNPTPLKDPLFEEIIWPKVSKTDHKYLDISTKMSVKTNPGNVAIWLRRLANYLENPKYI